MNCQKCGSPIPEGAKFCTECGTPVPAQPQIPQTPAAPQMPQAARYPQVPQTPRTPQAPAAPQAPQAPAAPQYQPQPMYPQYQQAPAYTPMPVKKKSKAPVIILVVVLALAFAGGALFLLPQLLGLHKNTPPESVPTPAPAVETPAPESSEAPKPSEPPVSSQPEETKGDSFPTAIRNAPKGMSVIRLGGLSIAAPEDYDLEDVYDDELTLLHPDYPETIAQIMMICEDGLEPGEEEEGMEELRDSVGNVVEEREFAGNGYSGRYLRGQLEADVLGITFTSHCYIFVTPGEIHGLAIMTDGKDARVEQVLQNIAFDPDIPASSGMTVIDSAVGTGFPDAEGDPTLADFAWAVNGADQIPEEYSLSVSEITGRWKCCVYYDDMDAYELCTAKFSGEDESLEMELQFFCMQYNGEPPVDESGEEPAKFYGAMKNGDLLLYGRATLESDAIYVCGGRQYLVGTLILQSGERYQVWMVRP